MRLSVTSSYIFFKDISCRIYNGNQARDFKHRDYYIWCFNLIAFVSKLFSIGNYLDLLSSFLRTVTDFVPILDLDSLA